ncbi:MAG: cobalamin biosynthesis protein CobQ [Pseudomonadota bacterium]
MVTLAAMLGAFLPDLSLYAMAGFHLLVLETPARVVFDELYYSDTWQQIFAVDNSFILWGIALALALWRRSAWAFALTGAALLHLALDFPLHNDDARMHFWPLTDWKFISPISYWEGARGGDVVGLIEIALVIVLTGFLVWRFRDHWCKWLFLTVAALQVMPFVVWRLVF